MRLGIHLGVSGMFWTQNLKPLAVGFTLRIIHITEESCCPGNTIDRIFVNI